MSNFSAHIMARTSFGFKLFLRWDDDDEQEIDIDF
jgi:hypothetical protein